MQSSSEQPLVGEENCVTTLITAARRLSIGRLVRIFLKYFLNRSRECLDLLPSLVMRMGGENISLLFCLILYGLLNFQHINFIFFLVD